MNPHRTINRTGPDRGPHRAPPVRPVPADVFTGQVYRTSSGPFTHETTESPDNYRTDLPDRIARSPKTQPDRFTGQDSRPDTLPNMLNAARYAAERGIPVFPVRPADKVPLLPRWQEVAQTTRQNPDTVDLIWSAAPMANLGYATGHVFDVLDLDGAKGIESLRRAVPSTYQHDGPIVRTGGGGLHLYFAPTGLTVHSRSDLGVDWRGAGGFVVGPPSIHHTGGRYLWERCYDDLEPLPVAPDWLLDYLDSIYRARSAPFTAQERRSADARPGTRQDIIEAAAESGLDVDRRGMTFCWNDVPGSPTQGHFNGNRKRSLSLYPNEGMFTCHQCGIWGFSDQLKARTWQGVR
jgi:bifunctional DNA primase/polymerase-like protein